jgi:hypothetical protein
MHAVISNQLNLYWCCYRLHKLALSHHLSLALEPLVSQVIFPSSSWINHVYIVLSSQMTPKLVMKNSEYKAFCLFCLSYFFFFPTLSFRCLFLLSFPFKYLYIKLLLSKIKYMLCFNYSNPKQTS